MDEPEAPPSAAKRNPPDDEVRVMSELARTLRKVNAPVSAAIVALAMQPLTPTDLAAVRTVTRLLGGLTDPVIAARVRTWVYDRFGPQVPEGGNPAEATWR
jgi:hypothetical protein